MPLFDFVGGGWDGKIKHLDIPASRRVIDVRNPAKVPVSWPPPETAKPPCFEVETYRITGRHHHITKAHVCVLSGLQEDTSYMGRHGLCQF